MSEIETFRAERQARIGSYSEDKRFQEISSEWRDVSLSRRYVYNFEWLGRPIIQFPQDIVGIQELIWQVKPDLIIETGIAHGGSLIFSASMLALLDICEGINPAESHRKVIGVDIDIRSHNRDAIEAHPLNRRIEMIQGSSVDPDVIEQVKNASRGYNRVLVCLDSMHTHDHVLAELEAYTPLVSIGSYCVVFDTVIEDMPDDSFPDRPWGRGNSPKTAVQSWIKLRSDFEIDRSRDRQLMITVNPDGFLKRIG